MIDFIFAILFADVTVEAHGYFLRWGGWQVICMCVMVVSGCIYVAYTMGRARI